MIEDIARVKEINVLISQLENEKKAIQDKHKSSIVTVAHAGGYIGLGVNLVELLIDCPDTKYLVL